MHALWTFWLNYFWASLKGNGPEAIIQTIVYAGIAYAVYPPFRKWLMHETGELHAKMDHIIRHHPDIPDYKEKNAPT